MQGNKLEGWAKPGRWIGFDDKSNRHKIYWTDKWNVTIERSVQFIDNDIVFSSNPITKLIQGESNPTSKNLTNENPTTEKNLPSNHDLENKSETPNNKAESENLP